MPLTLPTKQNRISDFNGHKTHFQSEIAFGVAQSEPSFIFKFSLDESFLYHDVLVESMS